MNDREPPPVPQPADYAARLLAIVRELSRELRHGASDIQRFGLDHALERDFGLDSLARVELLTRIERELGLRLAEAAFASAETPRDLLASIHTTAGLETTAPTATPLPGAPLEQPPEDIDTLTGLLDWHAARHGDWTYLTLYGDSEQAVAISYRQMQGEARALAAGLLARKLGAQARVAIMLPTCRQFFTAFFGALYAGCIPVPLYPPTRPAQREDHLRRIAGILTNAGAALLITDSQTGQLGHLVRDQCAELQALVTTEELSVPSSLPPAAWPTLTTRDIAFLQYTSGSTGNPKGVTLSHANLLANLRAMLSASGVSAADVFVSWLPLYHDMGLIGAGLGSLCAGFHLVLMPPLAFLARPVRWLQAIHRHRATVSAAPNFAYELCASKLTDADLAGLDLGNWRIAYNGAEPVSPATLERFAARLAPYGFRRDALTPVYGLAENSLGLTFPPPGRGPLTDVIERAALSELGIARPVPPDTAQAFRAASCGRPIPGHELRIVDAGGHALPERRVGRVQFRGPSATSGYFGNPEATARLFDGDWLNSGDLGYLADGELYLTGREKDLIIRGGHNIYPQELEEAVGRLDGVRKGGVAVFPATDAASGTERLVVLAEMHAGVAGDAATRQRLRAAINNLTVDLVGLPADDIVLAPPHAVQKTSSGKVRRAACRAAYESGELQRQLRPALWSALGQRLASRTVAIGQWLHRGGDALWALWAWLVFLIVVPPAWLLIVLTPTLGLRRRIARHSARLMLWLTGLTPRLDGRQYLGAHNVHDACIAVSNHASYLDALVLVASLPPRFAYIAKRELRANPFAAIPLRRLGCVFIERFDNARSVEDTDVLEALARSGESLVFFAEGTFRSTPGLLPFHLGAFRVAARCGLPVMALALSGTRTLLRGRERRPHFSRLRLGIAPPLRAEGSDWAAVLKLRDEARHWILRQLDEPDVG